jgi:hypothetical protein
MLKASVLMMTAMVLAGVSAASVQAAPSSDISVQAVDKSAQADGTWQIAHVSNWSHYHKCNPSPCKRLRDRHKKGTGSVTE